MPRRELTRAQALAWNPNWSYTDREIIEKHLDRLEAVTYYQPPSGGYVGCRDAGGRRVVFLYAGYITFGRGLGPEILADPNWEGTDLSTIQHKSGRSDTHRRQETFCPTHGTPILPSIGCEWCE